MSSPTTHPRLSGRSAESKPSNTPGLSQSGALLPSAYWSLPSRPSSWCLRCCCFVSLSSSCFLGFSFVWSRLFFLVFVCSFCLFGCLVFSAPLWSCFVFCLFVFVSCFLSFCLFLFVFCLFVSLVVFSSLFCFCFCFLLLLFVLFVCFLSFVLVSSYK